VGGILIILSSVSKFSLKCCWLVPDLKKLFVVLPEWAFTCFLLALSNHSSLSSDFISLEINQRTSFNCLLTTQCIFITSLLPKLSYSFVSARLQNLVGEGWLCLGYYYIFKANTGLSRVEVQNFLDNVSLPQIVKSIHILCNTSNKTKGKQQGNCLPHPIYT
jgi:hypothetical protein